MLLFELLALRTMLFLAEAFTFTLEAGFKMIDLAALKLAGFTSFFFGIKTFKEAAFLGAFKLKEACAAN